MREVHPDDDLLADLAAGQLPADRAEQVEAHVLTCATCSDLLAGAEQVRSLLRRQPVPAMPDDVAARLAGLVSAGPTAPAAPSTGTPSTGTQVPADRTAPTRILRPVTGRRLTPVGRGSRRQQLSEERTDVRHDRWTSYGRVAASVVAVLVLGGAAIAGVRAFGGGDASGERSAASDSGGRAAAAAAGAVTPVLATGRKYDAANLKSQVGALVADGRKQPVPEAATASGGLAGQASAAGSGQQLRSAAVLAGCLHAIGRTGQHPVAVDLATYQNREAAVIVLQQADASYEVWVVARTCHSGADGTIAVRTLSP